MFLIICLDVFILSHAFFLDRGLLVQRILVAPIGRAPFGVQGSAELRAGPTPACF